MQLSKLVRIFILAPIACIFIPLSYIGNASASTVVDGQIFGSGAGSTWQTTVGIHSFTMNTTGDASFNLLSWEDFGEDLNGSGDHFFFDTWVFLFHDDGNLVAENDDSDSLGWDADGSVDELDSFLVVAALAAGDYILAVASYPALADDLVDGVQGPTSGVWLESYDVGGNLTKNESQCVPPLTAGCDPTILHADYRVTFEGDITVVPPAVVPVPAAVWLFGTALIGLVGFSKRKSKVAA